MSKLSEVRKKQKIQTHSEKLLFLNMNFQNEMSGAIKEECGNLFLFIIFFLMVVDYLFGCGWSSRHVMVVVVHRSIK